MPKTAKRKRKTKKRSKAAAAPKTKGKRAFRVEAWFNGVAHETGVAKGTQTQKPGWRPRGTYAVRKLAQTHKAQIDRSEKVSTRIVSVPA